MNDYAYTGLTADALWEGANALGRQAGEINMQIEKLQRELDRVRNMERELERLWRERS